MDMAPEIGVLTDLMASGYVRHVHLWMDDHKDPRHVRGLLEQLQAGQTMTAAEFKEAIGRCVGAMWAAAAAIDAHQRSPQIGREGADEATVRDGFAVAVAGQSSALQAVLEARGNAEVAARAVRGEAEAPLKDPATQAHPHPPPPTTAPAPPSTPAASTQPAGPSGAAAPENGTAPTCTLPSTRLLHTYTTPRAQLHLLKRMRANRGGVAAIARISNDRRVIGEGGSVGELYREIRAGKIKSAPEFFERLCLCIDVVQAAARVEQEATASAIREAFAALRPGLRELMLAIRAHKAWAHHSALLADAKRYVRGAGGPAPLLQTNGPVAPADVVHEPAPAASLVAHRTHVYPLGAGSQHRDAHTGTNADAALTAGSPTARDGRLPHPPPTQPAALASTGLPDAPANTT